MESRESKPFTIIVAEDHAVARSGLEFLLSREPGIEILATARDGEEALRLTLDENPDLLILDLMLPKKSGMLVLQDLSDRVNRPRVLVLSGQINGSECQQLLALGADGIASKEDPAEELIAGLQALRGGERFLSSTVRGMLEPLEGKGKGGEESHPLTPREREILGLVAEGHSSAAIAQRLGIAVKTVKKHRENVREKLGISTVAEATRAAARLGLTKLS